MNKYSLYNSKGEKVAESKKQSFCLRNSGILIGGGNPGPLECPLENGQVLIIPTIPYPAPNGYLGENTNNQNLCNIYHKYECSTDENGPLSGKQGISYGWYDLYDKSLACQFIVVDEIPDGDYTLVSQTNAGSDKVRLDEDDYSNNSCLVGLHIEGNDANELNTYPIHITESDTDFVFNDIPEGEIIARAASFDIRSANSVTLKIIEGSLQIQPIIGLTPIIEPYKDGVFRYSGSDSIEPRKAYVWLLYHATKDGDIAEGTVRIRCVETGQEWTSNINANTVKRPTAAIVLAIDKSTSMLESSGFNDLPKRVDVLKLALNRLVELFLNFDEEGHLTKNGIGIVLFNHETDKKLPNTDGVLKMNSEALTKITNVIEGLEGEIGGSTAIAEAIELSDSILNESGLEYDRKSIIVFTDGKETAGKGLGGMDELGKNNRVYAIGLGNGDNIDAANLTSITSSTGGFLELTGNINNMDDKFLLHKYFVEMVTLAMEKEIVKDPIGWIYPNREKQIEFDLNETDVSFDIIVTAIAHNLSGSTSGDSDIFPQLNDLTLDIETPNGTKLLSTQIDSSSNIIARNFSSGIYLYYRYTLPVIIENNPHYSGRWHAILTLGKSKYKYHYQIMVRANSNIKMMSYLNKNSNHPGSTITVRAIITEYGLPLETDPNVYAEINQPDNTKFYLQLHKIDTGIFQSDMIGHLPGVYKFYIIANGETSRENRFTREQLRSIALWVGENDIPGRPQGNNICEFLMCLVDNKVISPELERRLQQVGIDLSSLKKCLEKFCK